MELLNKLNEYSHSNAYPMHMPGHKRRSEILPNALPWSIDITEIDSFDNLHEPEGILKSAQNIAAELFHVRHTFFLVGGSSCGILAAVRACSLMPVQNKRRALITRGCHRSVYNALELCGTDAVYIYPKLSDEYGIYTSVTPEDVGKAFSEYPDIKFVLITSPTYEGVVSDIKSIADIVHRNGAILIVDEAHGAHLDFSDIFPSSAVSCGADIVIQSVHKTLPALTQTAIMHICSDRVDINTIQRQLSVFQSSSPSYVLMSSIDACISLLKSDGERLFDDYKNRLLQFYSKTKKLKKLRIMPFENISGVFARDCSKIIIDTSSTELSGPQLADILRRRFLIETEMSQPDYVLAMTSVCDSYDGFSRLSDALFDIDSSLSFCKEKKTTKFIAEAPYRRFSAAQAVLLPQKPVLITNSAGHVSADYIWAYPPGIPLIVPGEIISESMIKNIDYMEKSGVDIHTSSAQKGLLSIIDEC